ncbi:hypothetical protein LOS19_00495 [Enterococcus faecium]|nr:hypothetical protein [Enterococcus faecium]
MLKDLKQYYPLSAYEKKKLFHFLAINLLAEQADSLDIASNQSLFFFGYRILPLKRSIRRKIRYFYQ